MFGVGVDCCKRGVGGNTQDPQSMEQPMNPGFKPKRQKKSSADITATRVGMRPMTPPVSGAKRPSWVNYVEKIEEVLSNNNFKSSQIQSARQAINGELLPIIKQLAQENGDASKRGLLNTDTNEKVFEALIDYSEQEDSLNTRDSLSIEFIDDILVTLFKFIDTFDSSEIRKCNLGNIFFMMLDLHSWADQMCPHLKKLSNHFEKLAQEDSDEFLKIFRSIHNPEKLRPWMHHIIHAAVFGVPEILNILVKLHLEDRLQDQDLWVFQKRDYEKREAHKNIDYTWLNELDTLFNSDLRPDDSGIIDYCDNIKNKLVIPYFFAHDLVPEHLKAPLKKYATEASCKTFLDFQEWKKAAMNPVTMQIMDKEDPTGNLSQDKFKDLFKEGIHFFAHKKTLEESASRLLCSFNFEADINQIFYCLFMRYLSKVVPFDKLESKCGELVEFLNKRIESPYSEMTDKDFCCILLLRLNKACNDVPDDDLSAL